MKKLIPALILTLAASAVCAREVDREPQRPAVAPQTVKLGRLIQFAGTSGPAAADLEGLIDCVKGYGSVGLAAGGPGVAVTCERTIAHDTLRDQLMIPASVIAAFNAAANDNLRVVDGVLGYGTGNPTAGLPSANWTAIFPGHAETALLWLIAERERLARPNNGAAPRVEPPLGSPDNPCATPPAEKAGEDRSQTPDTGYDSDGYHPTRRRAPAPAQPRAATPGYDSDGYHPTRRNSTPDHGSDDDGDPHDQTQEQDPLVSEQK